jgi:membrane-bound lytic murein transglycosylase MltF
LFRLRLLIVTLTLIVAGVPQRSSAELNPAWTGDLDGMVERRSIRALVPYNNTHFFLDRGRMHGATYESLMKFEEQLNRKLKRKNLRIKISFIPVFRDELIPALLDGKGDIAAAGLTITQARRNVVDFTDPVATGVDEIVVAAPKAPRMKRIEDLSGKEIYVRPSSSYADSLERLNESLKKAGKPPVAIREISEQLETEEILEMVNAGLLPLTIADNYLVKLWSKVFTGMVAYPDVAVNRDGQIAWMIRKDSPQLKQELNTFIKKHKRGTLFGNIIINRYFKNTKWIRNAVDDASIKRFQAAVAMFRKYGDKYDLDWLLVAACAFQESGIDQSKRSPAGAVGVMQLLPSTAAGDPINIPDIEKIEPNIHAGVKYLHWIHNTYFKDKAMDLPNQWRFTFAAYNAGPRRVQQMRKEASESGLDPNVWFNQAEIVAAKRIGRETVQYVRNIHKYYTAYRILIDKQTIKLKSSENVNTDS